MYKNLHFNAAGDRLQQEKFSTQLALKALIGRTWVHSARLQNLIAQLLAALFLSLIMCHNFYLRYYLPYHSLNCYRLARCCVINCDLDQSRYTHAYTLAVRAMLALIM